MLTKLEEGKMSEQALNENTLIQVEEFPVRLGKPGDKLLGKPGDKLLGKPGDKLLGKPGDKLLGKPSELCRDELMLYTYVI